MKTESVLPSHEIIDPTTRAIFNGAAGFTVVAASIYTAVHIGSTISLDDLTQGLLNHRQVLDFFALTLTALAAGVTGFNKLGKSIQVLRYGPK